MHQRYRGCDCYCNSVHSLFIANHSFEDSYVGKQGGSEKENLYRSGQIIFLRKALTGAPDATM